MAIVKGMEKLRSVGVRGTYGVPAAIRADPSLFPAHQAGNPLAGVYQRKKTLKGKQLSRMKYYHPTNPQTPEQQTWRAIFASGVTAWHALTPPEKVSYNKRASRLRLQGFCLFMRQFLVAHAL